MSRTTFASHYIPRFRTADLLFVCLFIVFNPSISCSISQISVCQKINPKIDLHMLLCGHVNRLLNSRPITFKNTLIVPITLSKSIALTNGKFIQR